MTTWITDDNGNRASVEYFGSRARAEAACKHKITRSRPVSNTNPAPRLTVHDGVATATKRDR